MMILSHYSTWSVELAETFDSFLGTYFAKAKAMAATLITRKIVIRSQFDTDHNECFPIFFHIRESLIVVRSETRPNIVGH